MIFENIKLYELTEFEKTVHVTEQLSHLNILGKLILSCEDKMLDCV